MTTEPRADGASGRAVGAFITATALAALALTRLGLSGLLLALAIAVILMGGAVILIRLTDRFRRRRVDAGYVMAFPAARMTDDGGLLRGRVQATQGALRWVSTEVRPISAASEQVWLELPAIDTIEVTPSRFHLTANVAFKSVTGARLLVKSGLSPSGTRRRLVRFRETAPAASFSIGPS